MTNQTQEPTTMPCPHCHGSGTVVVPPFVATVEAYYFGCWDQSGHYWFNRHGNRFVVRQEQVVYIEPLVGSKIHPRIDGGFCPGSIADKPYKRSRPEVEGEAAMHFMDGWTILSWWDRSVDRRGASNSNVVARGEHDFATMCAIAEAQFPEVWKRQKRAPVLIEPEAR